MGLLVHFGCVEEDWGLAEMEAYFLFNIFDQCFGRLLIVNFSNLYSIRWDKVLKAFGQLIRGMQ